MSKLYIKLLLASLLITLVSCASGPSGDSGSSPSAASAPPVNVDSATRDEYQKALGALNAGYTDQAITILTGLTRKQPNLAGPFVNLGILYLNKGRYADAKNALLQATTIKPADAIAQTHLGIAYRHLGEFKKAEASYREAIKADPKYAYAHLNAGILYDLYLQELALALQHYEQYKSLSPDKDDLVEKWIIDLKRRVGKNS